MALLQIARAERIARDIHLLEFRDPGGGALAAFTAGAHVQVACPNGALRKYSLCNPPRERHRYVVAVKRDPAGRGGSASLVDAARAGDKLEVSAPRNTFELVPGAQGHVLIAGGVGVTPLLSMAHVLAEAGARFHLYYCTRDTESTAFADEISRPPLAAHVTLHHDYGDPLRSLDLWPLLEKPSRDHVYCCGPRGMLEDVRAMSGHWPRAAIHFESFDDAASGAKPEDRVFEVVLARSGDRFQVPPGISILQALRGRGHEAPSSCESGTCGTCKTRVLDGVPDHRDFVLEDDERGSHVMICVSRALTPALVLDR